MSVLLRARRQAAKALDCNSSIVSSSLTARSKLSPKSNVQSPMSKVQRQESQTRRWTLDVGHWTNRRKEVP
jgi:hypothetical protein